jgi:hypothetical protein
MHFYMHPYLHKFFYSCKKWVLHLMNLPPWFLYSKKELCRQFTTHFESAYAQPGNEVDLHAVQ